MTNAWDAWLEAAEALFEEAAHRGHPLEVRQAAARLGVKIALDAPPEERDRMGDGLFEMFMFARRPASDGPLAEWEQPRAPRRTG